MTTFTKITVREQIDPAGIGDSTGKDTDWQERVCDLCAEEIETALSAAYPDAEIDVEVTVGRPGFASLSVEIDDGIAPSALTERVRDASQRGFDRACSGR
jgi:copper chaperone CopZ